MHRLPVSLSEPLSGEAIRQARYVLSKGGIIAFPTETLYGLACNPTDAAALKRLYELKSRDARLKLPFVASDDDQARRLVSWSGPWVGPLVERFWPGPLTLILPLKDSHPLAEWDWGPTLAIRVPGSAVARGLAGCLGYPIPATSANVSGEHGLQDPSRLDPKLIEGIDLLLDGGPLPDSPPSTLLDLSGASPRLLREGAVPAKLLLPYLGSPS